MKRVCALFLMGLLLLGCTACGGRSTSEPEGTTTRNAPTETPAPIPVSVQYVRTNGNLEDNGKIIIIESKAQLDEYYTRNRCEGEDFAPGKYAFDYGWDESKSFAESIAKYNKSFFEGHLLVLAILVVPSGSIRHEVTGMAGNTIYVQRIVPQMGTADMATWHLMIEVSRADWDGEGFELKLSDGDATAVPTTSQATTMTTQAPSRKSAAPLSTQTSPKQSTTSPSTSKPPDKTIHPALILRETKQDGLLLRVQVGLKSFSGEPITLTATITNTTKHDVTYGVGSGTPNVHQEIRVSIPGFTDMDLDGKVWTDDYRFVTLKVGETFTETIRFSPGGLPAGEYEGTAVFTYYTVLGESPGEAKRLELILFPN